MLYSTLNNYSNAFGLTRELLYLVSLDISSSRLLQPPSPFDPAFRAGMKRWRVTWKERDEWKEDIRHCPLSPSVNNPSSMLLLPSLFPSAFGLKLTFRPEQYFSLLRSIISSDQKTHHWMHCANTNLAIQITLGGCNDPEGWVMNTIYTAAYLLLLLLHNPSQHLSPLPENATYSMKEPRATKQVLHPLLLLSAHYKAPSTYRTKHGEGQSISSVPICCSTYRTDKLYSLVFKPTRTVS